MFKKQIKELFSYNPDLYRRQDSVEVSESFWDFVGFVGQQKPKITDSRVKTLWNRFVLVLRAKIYDDNSEIFTDLSLKDFHRTHTSAFCYDFPLKLRTIEEAKIARNNRESIKLNIKEIRQEQEVRNNLWGVKEFKSKITQTENNSIGGNNTLNESIAQQLIGYRKRGINIYAGKTANYFGIEAQKDIKIDILAATSYFFQQSLANIVVPFRGFLIQGVAGIGKTAMIKDITYQLDHEFSNRDNTSVGLYLIDSGDIAAAKWGQAEQRLRSIFQSALDSEEFDKTILLFDDIDTFILGRDMHLAREFHFSINSIFFHELDKLDITKVMVIGTSNRVDLVDPALRSRLFLHTLEPPTINELMIIAENYATSINIPNQSDFLTNLQQDLKDNYEHPTMRTLEDIFNRAMISEFRNQYLMQWH